ncbi:MAG: glycoside hydrolase family 2 [Halothiobacillaceae bacterium]|nr:MAG: glycoside hydrolase family 2 [Halothiobacillaceae bacterium]
MRALRLALLMLIVAAHSGCASHSTQLQDAEPRTHALNGTWSFLAGELRPAAPAAVDAETGWRDIQVPDNWYRQGHEMHGRVWYRRTFTLNAKDMDRHIRLVFNAVDYAADAWLNGHHLGHHEGYFQPFDFDISRHVRQGENTLHVLVDSPIEDPLHAWSLRKRLIKGIYSHHDTRPGGAWSPRGQERNTGGIWAPVTLELSDAAAVRTLRVTPRSQAGGAWTTHVDAAIGGEADAISEVEVHIRPENFDGAPIVQIQPVSLRRGEGLSLDIPIHQPKPWWPREHGAPNLYRLSLILRDGQRILDRKETVFGYRTFTVDPVTQAWFVNGRRLFIRGTNYISTQWLAEMDAARYAQDLRMMTEAHVNAVRVHAHIEAPAFYEACDRAGMLVLQDFPLQWGYSDSADFLAEARSQARDMVEHLQNHPSIAVWSMHNEPPWDASWMKWKYPDYAPDQNRILDDLLERDVSRLDSTRVTHKVSATYEHPWFGWYSGDWKDYGKPAVTPWITEYGAQALPELASLRRIFNEDELWPDNDQDWSKWSYHNFQRHETFDLAKVPAGSHIGEFIANTQQYQARLIKFAAESYRRQRYQPVSAIFQFMFVEDWPSINWGTVDYWRIPKPGYEALKIAYQPVLPGIDGLRDAYAAGERLSLRPWGINDLWQDIRNARYQLDLRAGERVLVQREWALDPLAADASHELGPLEIDTAGFQPGDYVLLTRIVSADGLTLGHNRYPFTITPSTQARTPVAPR